MYEKDGEKYFIVDGHQHFWDASPANWVKGQEQYAKGWIECFHAYMGLGPADTHWPLEKFQKYSEDDYAHDVFEAGHIDHASSSRLTSRSGTRTASTPPSATPEWSRSSPTS